MLSECQPVSIAVDVGELIAGKDVVCVQAEIFKIEVGRLYNKSTAQSVACAITAVIAIVVAEEFYAVAALDGDKTLGKSLGFDVFVKGICAGDIAVGTSVIENHLKIYKLAV